VNKTKSLPSKSLYSSGSDIKPVHYRKEQQSRFHSHSEAHTFHILAKLQKE